MLKFKSRKGEVAALLTLGLVLIGSLVTIGISYLTSTNKIASNPRADESCTPTEGVNQSICFCKVGSPVQIYATWDARVANCMTTGIQSYINANSYGTKNWAYCTSAADFPLDCESSGGTPPGSETPPEGCQNTTCKEESFGNSSHDVSYYKDKPDKFYFEKNCGGTSVNRTVIMDGEHCGGAVQGDCTETPCGNFNTELKEMDNYDREFAKTHTVYTKTGDPKFYDGKPCDELNEITLAEACIPPASETHTCTIDVQCSDILGDDFTGTLFQWSDAQGPGENYYITESCLSVADPDEDCEKIDSPEPLSGFSCSGMRSYTIPGGSTCSCYFQELDGGDQLQTSFATFSNLCTNTCHGNPYLGDSGFGGKDNGYCCPKDCGG